MKYLKYIIENDEVQQLIYKNEGFLNNSLEQFQEFHNTLYIDVCENLNKFSSKDDIKSYALNKTLKFINENLLSHLIAGGIGAWLLTQITKLWDHINPVKKIEVSLKDVVDEKLELLVDKVTDNTIKVADKVTDVSMNIADRIDKATGSNLDAATNHVVDKVTDTIINEKNLTQKPIESIDEADFINYPLLAIIGAALSIYTYDKLSKQYLSIRKIAGLKSQLDSSYDRLIALGNSELEDLREVNLKKYRELLNSCADKKSPFGVFTVDVSCPLNAYLTYCCNMILSICALYLKKTNTSNISSMRSLLSIKDEFVMNSIILSLYNQFIFSIEFIYKDEPGLISKWKSNIDYNIEKLSQSAKHDNRQYIQTNSNNRNYNK